MRRIAGAVTDPGRLLRGSSQSLRTIVATYSGFMGSSWRGSSRSKSSNFGQSRLARRRACYDDGHKSMKEGMTVATVLMKGDEPPLPAFRGRCALRNPPCAAMVVLRWCGERPQRDRSLRAAAQTPVTASASALTAPGPWCLCSPGPVKRACPVPFCLTERSTHARLFPIDLARFLTYVPPWRGPHA